MDQIQNNSSPYPPLRPSSNDSSTFSAARQQLQYQQQQQQHQQHRLLTQQQLYTNLQQQQPQLSPLSLPQHYFADGISPTHTSPPTSASTASWPLQRTSNTRDEAHPRQQQQQQQYFPEPPQQLQRSPPQPPQPSHSITVKREPTMSDKVSASSSNGQSHPPARSSEDPMPSTSDFVKKLYKMLEDPLFQSVVCWGPQGDCFVVKDMNEFTKSILPRMFKHSNFASFVRQLNKYDFHKVKNTDDNQFGEHSWTFRHPDFHADRRDALENIKRKVPAARKSQSSASSTNPLSSHPYTSSSGRGRSTSPPSLSQLPPHIAAQLSNGSLSLGSTGGSPNSAVLQAEIQRLKEEGDDLRGRIRNLERNYESVLVEMVGFQRGMAQQDGLMQSLIAYFLGSESGKLKASSGSTPGQLHGASASGSLQRTGGPSSQSPGASGSGSRLGAGPSSETGISQQLHAQLQQQQNQHERAQAVLQAQLTQVVSQREVDGDSDPSNTIEGGSEQRQSDSLNNAKPTLATAQYTGRLGGISSLADSSNPFLPPHAVRGILGSNGGASTTSGGSQGTSSSGAVVSGGFPSNGGDLGRATLMQMSELSRRAAYLTANVMTGGVSAAAASGSQPLWSGLNFSGGDGGAGDAVAGAGSSKMTRAEALAQIRDLHRERLTQGGWANAPVTNLPLGVGVGGLGATRRSLSEERERDRLGFSMSMTRDDSSSASQMQLDQERGRSKAISRRRQSDSAATSGLSGLLDTSTARDLSAVESPEEFVMPSPSQGSLQAASSSKASSSASSPQQSRQQTATPNPWASLMNGQGFLTSLDSSSQPGFSGAGASGSGSIFNFGASGENGSLAHEGLQVYTVGHLLPRGMGLGGADDAQGWPAFDTVPGQVGTSGATPSAVGEGENEDDETVQPTPTNSLVARPVPPIASSSTMSPPKSSPSSQKLRVRRSTYVPGWAVPPRVLLVDDDAVSRKLSSKFLQVFGCTTDVAVDGIAAVNKMNLEKYDLVLMDIVMPKLDGVSATNLIRKFDQGTPIISMTSNSKPNEIMTYYSSGMNDILPKPFTKQGLFDMLEKHLMHLKVIQQMSKLPRSVGIPPLSDANFEQAFASASNFLTMQPSAASPSNLIAGPSTSGTPDPSSSADTSAVANAPSPFNFSFNFGDGDDGRINPLAGMGLTDEQYNAILQNIVNGDGFIGMFDGGANGSSSSSENGEKRPLEDPSEDGRDGKRSRFEVIE